MQRNPKLVTRSYKYISDPEIERMSKEQEDLRLQIEKCQNHEQIKQLSKSRKKIPKQISHKIKDAKEKFVEGLSWRNRECER